MLSLLLIFCAAASASPEVPPPAAGTYRYQGEFQVSSRIRYSVVRTLNQAGQEELRARQRAGEECRLKIHETYLCRANVPVSGPYGELGPRVAERREGQDLDLGPLRGDPELVSKGEVVAEYSVPQFAAFRGVNYAAYRWVMTRRGWSVRLGEPTAEQFNFRNGNLERFLEIPVPTDANHYDLFIVSGVLRRI